MFKWIKRDNGSINKFKVSMTITIVALIATGLTLLPQGAYSQELSRTGADINDKTLNEDNGLIFEHKLTLEEDASNRPKMEVVITNIQEDRLDLDVMGTIHGNIACEVGPEEKLFEFIDYDSMRIRSADGEKLDFSLEGRKISSEDLDDYVWDDFFNVDGLQIETGSYQTIIIEYKLVSNHELWEGFGTDLSAFEGYDDPSHFWAVYLEWFILRPTEQKDGLIKNNTFEIDFPSGWNYVTTYPEEDNLIDLGELKFMRWTNDKNWMNYQRSPFMLFNTDSFLLDEKEVAGTVFQDVYPKYYDNIRNHEANYQYFAYFSDFIGELPVDKVITFPGPGLEGGGSATKYGDSYARAPYAYGYSSKGKYFTGSAGADIGYGGKKIDEPQGWCIERWPDDETNHLYPIHPVARMWAGTIIQTHIEGGLAAYMGSQAVASYYADWNVVENRYKPKYEFYLEEVVQDDGSEKEVEGVTGHGFHGYFKNSLAFYYFDHRIQEETNGEKDLSDVFHYVYDQVLQGKNLLENEEELWLDAFYHTVEEGIDFEEKVKGYLYGDVYGHKFLNLSDYIDEIYEIAILPEPEVGGEVENEGIYIKGEEVTLVATPEEGYEFINWTEDGGEVSDTKKYTFTVKGDRELKANFEKAGTRLAGENRYETAIEISQDGWESAGTVIIARCDDYPDSLAGVPLAYALDAPVLLTETEELHEETGKEIERLDAGEAIILGGTAAITGEVEDELDGLVDKVERIGGKNRYKTAKMIADRLQEETGGFEEAFVAVGDDFPDALSAASYAAMREMPILLSQTESLPDPTEGALDKLEITATVVAGGDAVISDSVFEELPDAVRVAGADRWETSRDLAEEYLEEEAEKIYLATGNNFPDALAGGVLAAKDASGVLLVPGDEAELPEITKEFFSEQAITRARIFGGTAAVGVGIAHSLLEILE